MTRSKKNKSSNKVKRFSILLVIVLALSGSSLFYHYYKQIFYPNIATLSKDDPYLYIPTDSDFEVVIHLLHQKELLKDEASFRWVAEKMNYPKNVKSGRYRIDKGMNNRELIALLRSGKQEPLLVVFHNIRTRKQLASVVSKQIEADSSAILGLLANQSFLEELGFTTENVMSMFIPESYEFYWNTSAKGFLKRMKQEYDLFWNEKKKEQARNIGLSPIGVSVMASIVEQETHKDDEKPMIAGVYMNRYNKGWKLEADPTLVFAAGDFSIQRVLNKHKEIESPYNTYKYPGLPPGPICAPSKSSIKAVLNYSKHDYLFFCAKDDFSGYHSFARTYNQHLVNARKFQRELNRRNIKS